MRALVTGGAAGLGAAMVARLETEGFAVDVLDLTTGFDVSDPGQWDSVGPVDVACLNAGVLGGEADPAEISLETYRRAMSVNVDGVVREAAADLLRLWDAGKMRPIVGATFPLAEAAEAHHLVESRQSTGKVILVP